jgi:hypothetical protein
VPQRYGVTVQLPPVQLQVAAPLHWSVHPPGVQCVIVQDWLP